MNIINCINMSCLIIITKLFVLEEAATSLGQREDLIKRVVEWCNIEEYPSIQGEANRFIAWLINNSRYVFHHSPRDDSLSYIYIYIYIYIF